MSQAYEFLKECDAFFVLTINGDYPAGRPFGVVMELADTLYIATNNFNSAHQQLQDNGHVQILAKKADSRDWIRITGIAAECHDIAIKKMMYDQNPRLHAHYAGAEDEHFLMFAITVEQVEIK